MALSTKAQLPLEQDINPISWQYRVEKIGDHAFMLHMTAIIQPGWHIYAQQQPEDAIAIPTTIKFKDDSLITFDGVPKERGNKEKYYNKILGISDWQYEDTVDFVQILKIHKNGQARIEGCITYQACRDKECLKPSTRSFSITVKD